MAVYDFKCTKSGTKFEVTCHMDERVPKCAQCGSHRVKQQFSSAFTSPPRQ